MSSKLTLFYTGERISTQTSDPYLLFTVNTFLDVILYILPHFLIFLWSFDERFVAATAFSSKKINFLSKIHIFFNIDFKKDTYTSKVTAIKKKWCHILRHTKLKTILPGFRNLNYKLSKLKLTSQIPILTLLRKSSK